MIVVRFRDGRDDELKEWYENLPEGERSRIIRRILLEYISVNQNNTKSMADNIKIKRTNSNENDNSIISKKIDSLINIF